MIRHRRNPSRWFAATATASLIASVSLAATPSPAAAADPRATLVRTTNTFAWASPSPDPSGIAYNSRTDRLIVVDGEVDEIPALFENVNLWEATRAGTVVSTGLTTAYSNEPVGAGMDPSANRLFIADDDADVIHEVRPGGDNRFGTGDDVRRMFSTIAYGSGDPSGITYALGDLFIADDTGTDVFRIDPGANRQFDGGGDDRVIRRFDVAALGQSAPEGIEYDPRTNSLFLVSENRFSNLTQVTLSGVLLQTIDLADIPINAPGGLTLGPRTSNASLQSFFIADRGVDNVINPRENDGRIFEIAVATTPFTDIASHPFRADIEWLFGSGITRGCAATLFCPNSTVTREQMASFLARALSLPAATRDYFSDDNSSQHEADINRVAQARITGGCATGRYCPKQVVTREQMASFLARAFDLPASSRDFFSDDNSSQHEGNINRVAQAGITGGCAPGRYCPTGSVTRGQMAAFLHRAF